MYSLSAYYGESKDEIVLELGIQLAIDIFRVFVARDVYGKPIGIFWKLNSDCSIIAGVGPSISSDVFSGYISYFELNKQSHGRLDNELREFRHMLLHYNHSLSSDPLSYGLTWWGVQWIEDPAMQDRIRDGFLHGNRAHRVEDAALNIEHGMELPFRLYGAILGAKLSRVTRLVEKANDILEQVLLLLQRKDLVAIDEHSAINKVMLVSALEPWAFRKQ